VAAPNGIASLAIPAKPLTSQQYANYALSDPGYLALQAATQGNEGAYTAQARGGINKGVIDLGLAPTDSSLSGWLDPGTAAAAAANPLSTQAQLTTAHTNNVRAIQNNLAARGGYDSGELTYGLGNENQRDTQAHADALSKFIDYANGLFSNLGAMQASDAASLGQELGNAALRQLKLHPGTTTTALWNDATGTYVDADGNHYDAFGNLTTPGAGASGDSGAGYVVNPSDWGGNQGTSGPAIGSAGTPGTYSFAPTVPGNYSFPVDTTPPSYAPPAPQQTVQTQSAPTPIVRQGVPRFS
jgi:hypothetical protein